MPRPIPPRNWPAYTCGAGASNCGSVTSRLPWAWKCCAVKVPRCCTRNWKCFSSLYNLIRCLMAEAGAIYEVPMERLSFKGTVDSVRQFSVAIAQAPSRKKQKQLIAQLLEIIAQDQVPDRPGRRDPRAVKRRPKPFPLLNRPRDKFKEIAHRNRYWKNNPRKINR